MFLAGCTAGEHIEVQSNGGGLKVVDVLGASSRRVCVMADEDTAPCTSEVAQLIVHDIDVKGQMVVRWRAAGSDLVEGVLFGGTIVRCASRDPASRFRMSIHQLPPESMPAPDQWSVQEIIARWREGPVSCGQSFL